MQGLRFLSRVAMLAWCLAVPAWAGADEASEALQKGVALFDEGKYLAAQEVLLNVDRDTLTEEERALRDEYVDRVSVAINMVDKADQEIEDAQAALTADRFTEAKTLFKSVLENEYASATILQAAEEGLREAVARESRDRRELESAPVAVADMTERAPTDAAPPATAPVEVEGDATAEARILTQRGFAALDAGDLDKALGLFNRAVTVVPGYPEAVSGIERVRAHAKVESGAVPLIERIHRRNLIRWQRVTASYRDAEVEAREHVINDRFDLAKQAVLRARQIVESGKEFAEPLSRYESLRAEVDALARFVGDEERDCAERTVRETRDEIALRDSERLRQMRLQKQQRIDALMSQAARHRKDRDPEAAIDLLRQVVVIDPRNDQARWMLDNLEDMWAYLRQRESLTTRRKETQEVLTQVAEAKVPWHEFLKYPKNWLEIISRPDRVISGQEYLSVEDQALRNKLGTRLPVTFDDTPFGEVIETLQDTQQVNITVVWSDLEAQGGITEDEPVTLILPTEITFKKALDEILAQLGGGTLELGYVVSEGIIKIASRDLLDRDVFPEVYDITDLLHPVPDYRNAPEVNLQQGGGGGGAGGGSASQNPFQGGGGGGGGDDEIDIEARANEIVELIRETIEPESWREAGGTDASILAFDTNLVVTQTASAHGQVADLLSQLRQERAIQIVIEARFLTIAANYLEEMGVDLDIILNQGNAGYDRVNPVGEGAALLLPRSFSQLGFGPAVPGVGTAFQPGVVSGTTTDIRQPFGNAALVPQSSNIMHSGSRMTPVPFLSNVLDLTATQTTSIPGSLGGGGSPALQVFGSFLDNIQVDFLLRATQADRRGSTMSAPRIVLFNGQKAWIGVLREQAYVNTVQPVVDETAVAQRPEVQLIYTGTVLDVRATVSADKRYVTMNLEPSVATLESIELFPYSGGAAGTAAGGGFIQLPTRQVQRLQTTVTVPDRGTLLFGGMKTSEEVEIEAGVPVLSKIPVLKRLYSNRSLVKDEQVLMILVKPTIIITREAEEEAFPTFASQG